MTIEDKTSQPNEGVKVRHTFRKHSVDNYDTYIAKTLSNALKSAIRRQTIPSWLKNELSKEDKQLLLAVLTEEPSEEQVEIIHKGFGL